jgi:hypothetical protein
MKLLKHSQTKACRHIFVAGDFFEEKQMESLKQLELR